MWLVCCCFGEKKDDGEHLSGQTNGKDEYDTNVQGDGVSRVNPSYIREAPLCGNGGDSALQHNVKSSCSTQRRIDVSGFDVQDLTSCVDQGLDVNEPSIEMQGGRLVIRNFEENSRGFQLFKERLESVHKEKRAMTPGRPLVNANSQDDQRTETSPLDHQCPGMTEVLELIRDGVSLRHIVKGQQVNAIGEDGQCETGGRVLPELHQILKKRKMSSENHVSDGSVKGDNANPQRQEVESCASTLRRSPGQGDLSYVFHATENVQETDVVGEETDDTLSTTSTLPLTTSLDQSEALSCFLLESPVSFLSTDVPTPLLTGSVDKGWVCHSKLVDSSISCLQSPPGTTDQSPMTEYLNRAESSSVKVIAVEKN